MIQTLKIRNILNFIKQHEDSSLDSVFSLVRKKKKREKKKKITFRKV